jgi:hypothetical protein
MVHQGLDVVPIGLSRLAHQAHRCRDATLVVPEIFAIGLIARIVGEQELCHRTVDATAGAVINPLVLCCERWTNHPHAMHGALCRADAVSSIQQQLAVQTATRRCARGSE